MSEQSHPGAEGRPSEDRRSDLLVRRHVRQLLELIREFYGTCHMVALGQLSAAKAKSKAQDMERKLQIMMNDMLARIEPTAVEREENDHAS